MKHRLSCLFALLLAVLCLPGCGKTYDDGYAEGYDDGYMEGYSDCELYWDDMYYEGYGDCADELDDWWDSLDDDYIGNHGYTMLEAMQSLSDYIDGVPVEKEVLEDALWILRRFYEDVDTIVSEINFY